MTRPRVPDDKRIRTAQACESCKRRKQKCNGLQPCNTCQKRNFVCEYAPPNGLSLQTLTSADAEDRRSVSASSPSDRRKSVNTIGVGSPEEPPSKRYKPAGNPYTVPPFHQRFLNAPHGLPGPFPAPQMPGHNGRDAGLEARSGQSTTSGGDEVAEVYTETRMLQDPTGRLLYLGDSATLSYLQFIRMIVESVVGPSQFTTDPNRHRLMEATSTLAPNDSGVALLPDRRTTDVLVASYFTNTNSMIEVFDRKAFAQKLETCYAEPMAAEPTFLCLLYLVLAIGLLLATPLPGSEEEKTLQKLQAGHADRAEQFFRSAKKMCDPASGFEDADFWSVQALLLMSVFMLTKTKRNAAYAYLGMAVRSAYALGLHRLETMVVFDVPDRVQRRNVWRSLYILDRFLAAALGRPTSISEEDCSVDALVTPDNYLADSKTDSASYGGLNAAVKSCQVISDILKQVYAQRRISTKLAHDISEKCAGGPEQHSPGLHWRQAMNRRIDPTHGMALLHVNLLYCHAVILLTRPFFLYLMNRLQLEKLGIPRAAIRTGSKMHKFSEACVNASYHTITLVHLAAEGGYLPQRDPFVIHFLFAATLVVMSSEFASLHRNSTYADIVQKAMNIMSYCARSDPQANRLVYILTTFNHIIVRRLPTIAPPSFPDTEQPGPNTPTGSSSNSSMDPMANFFPGTPTAPPKVPNPLPLTSHEPGSNNNDSDKDNGKPIVGPPTQSPGTLQTAAPTPTTSSAAGEFMNEAEWFHFDTLWENWAAPPGTNGGAGAGAGAPSSLSATATDPTLFGSNPPSAFGSVSGQGGASSSARGFPGGPPPHMVAHGGGDDRFHNASAAGAMPVPMYSLMRFNE